MAIARQSSKGGLTAAHIWMIGFVFLWLTSTVLLVWLYTDQEGLRNDNDQLRRENARIVRGPDKSLPAYAQASESGSSMARLSEDARRDATVLAIGEEADDVQTARTKIVALFDRIIDDGLIGETAQFETPELLPAMIVLYEHYKGAYNLREEAENRAFAAEGKLRDAIEANTNDKESFDAKVDQLRGRIDDLEQTHAAYAQSRDTEVDDFKRQMDELRQQFSRDVQVQRNAAQSERQKLEELQSRYTELQAKLGELQITPGKRLTARRADGQVVMAVRGDNVIYINLGRAHQLTTGLQFAVYPASGIPADGRAKGRIEVARIHADTAECTVLALDPSEVIVEGDLIANPVYDRTRPLRFVVVGNFDLNGDGRDDRDGAERIAGIIQDWGGEVLDTLSSRADFVVAGYAPDVPQSVGSAKASRDPGVLERERLARRRLDEYNGIVSSATQLSIPILTQDVFLRFLGY